ncbi:MAG: hypothetical protein GXO64_03095 [Candidatus Micrarchaeota archaeon]|nr:hypothetical protein [Candidatus Micrarchaeota archaeon]
MGELHIGVTTGIYMAAHSEELATVVRKIGYAFTRGANCIELAGDVPHEVNHTDGQEIRRIAKHQGLTLTFHGSLTTPMTVSERSDWRDAQNHMEKSVKSAVHAGAQYTLFHACLHYWFELLSYTSGKLEVLMCDFWGRPVSEILYEDEKFGSKKLQDWWIEYSWNTEYQYNLLILSEEERNEVSARVSAEYGGDWIEQKIATKIRDNPSIMNKIRDTMIKNQIEKYKENGVPEEVIQKNMSDIVKMVDDHLEIAQLYKQVLNDDRVYNAIKKEFDEIRKKVHKELGEKQAKAQRGAIRDYVKKKMNKGTPTDRSLRRWNVENRGKYTDAYNLLFHYLFFNRNTEPIWDAFVSVYEETLRNYKYFEYMKDPKKCDRWPDIALELAEERNERQFKEFFYGIVGARMVIGHMERLYEWMNKEKPGGLIYELTHSNFEDVDELVKVAKNMKITIEIPDSRDSKYAGLYILWHPKQLYALVKTLRQIVDKKKFYITWDFEHLAGQGVDPIQEMENVILDKNKGGLGLKDIGSYTLSVHCNKPNPLHGHVPIELGDREVYHLLWLCRRTGMGKKDNDVYLFFERGGGQDPFKQSVDALRLMVPYLEKEVPYEEVGPDMFGLTLTAGDVERQKQIVLQHRFELVKELMQVPEEEWGWLSGVATRKGKTKEWKKNELGGL